MAYSAASNPRSRISTGLTVIALQALVAYGVVTALTFTGVLAPPMPEPTATNIPLPPPTDNPYDHKKDHTLPPPSGPIARPTDTIITLPTPSPTALPSDEFTGGPIVGTGPTGTGSATPTETPSPAFTPKAPTARGNMGDWVTTGDYPLQDLREGHEGVVRVLLGIGADGRVTSCSVTGSSGFAGLDARACDRLRAKGRFDPATDSTGAKVAGTVRTAVRWTIPK